MTPNKGISGAILKWLALVTMLIDHIGATIIRHYRILPNCPASIKLTYEIMRNIGRIAFPIFIFLLVEGYQHTKSRKKYLMRLLVFAVISEVPFDMAFKNSFWNIGYQNVFFTLSLGLIAIWLMDEIKKRSSLHIKEPVAAAAYTNLLSLGVIAVFCLLAEFMETDYHSVGIFAIAVAWLLKDKRYLQMPACCLTLRLSSKREWYAFIACLPILFYNGKRGKQHKYFSYFFYPVHLLILGYICMYILQ